MFNNRKVCRVTFALPVYKRYRGFPFKVAAFRSIISHWEVQILIQLPPSSFRYSATLTQGRWESVNSSLLLGLYSISIYLYPWFFSPLWHFDPLPGHNFPLRGFAITLIGHATFDRLLWTSNQPEAQTFTWQHATLTTDIHPCPRWNSNPQSQQVSGRRPTP